MRNRSDPLRLFHAADIHLGAPFRSFPEQADVLRSEQFDAFLSLLEQCAQEKPDLLLLAGDLFDRPDPPPALARRTADALSLAPDTRVFISPGNHDPAVLDSPYRTLEWPDNVTVFLQNKSVDLPDMDACISGAGFLSEAAVRPLFAPPPANDTTDGPTRILVLHGDLDAAAGTPYNPIRSDELHMGGFSYVALGHRHAPQVGTTGQDLRSPVETVRSFVPHRTVVAYSGCLAGRGFDETGSAGYLDVTLDPAGTRVAFRTVPRPARCMIRIPVPMSPDDTPDDVVQNVERAIAAGGSDAERHLYRITLTGTRAPDEPAPTDRILFRLRERVFALQVEDETQPARDLERLEQEQSLRGLYVRALMDRIREAEHRNADREARVLRMAMQEGLDAMDGEEPG